MSAPYLLRLLCISLASFFLIHFAAGLLVSLLAPVAVRAAERMQPRDAARFLLALRLAPAAFAAAVVGGLCIPSYLWLEPADSSEQLGFACVAFALLALAALAVSLSRSWRATSRSLGYIRYCRMVGRRTCLAPEGCPAWVVESGKPFLVLAGIIHPKLMVSRNLVASLGGEQLAMALRHEQAHRISRDNLKRLLVLIAPGVLPVWRGFDLLERAWARFTEWAADDHAVAGDPRLSVTLASTLVRVARLGASPHVPPLVTSLLADDHDLAERVDRLLRRPAVTEQTGLPIRTIGLGAASAALAAMMQPSTLYAAHRLLEHLTR